MKMKVVCILTLLCLTLSTTIAQQQSPLEGRWDLTISMDGKENPSWLEVVHSGHKTLVGHFVGVWGSSRPISEVKVNGNNFSFAIPPQWEEGEQDMVVEGTVANNNLSGSIVFPDGKKYSWKGVRAPSLRRDKEGKWGQPIALIKKNSLDGWKALGENQWVVEGGVLKNPKSGSNLITEQKFEDFKIHLEFRYPKGSNSGIYLRGRYEVQIADSQGKGPLPGELGGVYGFIAPSEQVAKNPDQWQSYDITLIGRMITVVANGIPVITNQEIPGITGGALDSNEGEAGPLQLQGDHGPVEFRNMIITPMEY